jgi:predicted transposase/invertase (TIGR01784 family)
VNIVVKLEYTFKNDTLFKMLFVQYPDLLQKLVAGLLGIAVDSIEEFVIRNPEMPPESLGDKFCRLDISMTVNGQRVNLEVQVLDRGDFPERTLFHWAREYSTALPSGGKYRELPRVLIINIVAFKLFDCEEFHSEYRPLEVTRYTLLTDKQVLHYFELPKLPEVISADDELKLWLALFKADTEEELQQIESLEVPVMQEAIRAYRSITVTPKFLEAERLRSIARHDEAQALFHAEQIGEKREREKWQGVVAEKDAILADKDAILADKDAILADKDAENARLRERLAVLQAQLGEQK